MKTKFAIVHPSRYTHGVAWVDAEDGDEGAHLGQDAHKGVAGLEKELADARALHKAGSQNQTDAIEYFAVELAALRWFQNQKGGSGSVGVIGPCGFELESETKAKELRALASETVKRALEETPLPAWAETALAAGWKPPKGWKP